MQKGFNSDVSVKGKSYHVQTEDWGQQNPFFVSRVFCNGAVVKTFKISHLDALKTEPVNLAEALKLALRKQHQQVMDMVFNGQL